MSNKYENMVFCDIETSGLGVKTSEIIEIAAYAIDYKANKIDEFETFCKPSKAIPFEATKINGITNEMVKDYPSPEACTEQFFEWLKSIGSNYLFFHNAPFDAKFLTHTAINANYAFENYKTIDTLSWSRKLYDLKSYKLERILTEKCEDFELFPSHRALNDCKNLLELVKLNIRHLKQENKIIKLKDMYNEFFQLSKTLSLHSTPAPKKDNKTYKYKKVSFNKTNRSF
jgi:DNA polymerase III epsilon subunit family exonuclease